MKLRLIVIGAGGKDRQDPLCTAADEYLGRIKRYFPIELVELKEEPLKRKTPVEHARKVEAERIRKALGERDRMIAMDERGKELTSQALAQKLERFSHQGTTMNFVVGGPSGLERALLDEAQERWRLSAMTLPHRMARLILAEQLYRACTILRGEPYHK